MEATDVVGYFAAGLTTISYIPQLYKIFKTKDTKSVSMPMYILTNVSTLMWLIYGIMSSNWPIIISDSIALVFAAVILIYKLKNDGAGS